jgi:hypothetical protein
MTAAGVGNGFANGLRGVVMLIFTIYSRSSYFWYMGSTSNWTFKLDIE